MNRKLISILLYIVVCIFSESVFALPVSLTMNFSEKDIEWKNAGKGKFILTIKGLELENQIGDYPVSFKTLILVIPEGKDLLDVAYRPLKIVTFRLKHSLIKSEEAISFYAENSIFQEEKICKTSPENKEWISKPVITLMGGYKVLRMKIYPIKFEAMQQKFEFCKELKISFTWSNEIVSGEIVKNNSRAAYQYLAKRIANPSDLYPPTKSNPNCQWLLISSDELLPAFSPLTLWRKELGFTVCTETIENILAAAAGQDDAEKLRNYIIDKLQNDGLEYLVLGGDTNIIPFRYAQASNCAGTDSFPDENDQLSDLYFSDLTGSWDDDGDGQFGEVDDNIDMDFDIVVGRLPVKTVSDVNNIVGKILTYEKQSPTGTCMNALFWAASLGTNVPVGGVLDTAEALLNNFTIHKEYETPKSNVISYWNNGVGLICHEAHSHSDYLGAGNSEQFDISDISSLTQSNMPPVMYSVGCYAGAFDYPKLDITENAISENLLLSNISGICAFIGNSRNGWYNPILPILGESAIYYRNFFNDLVNSDAFRIGDVFAAAKADCVASSGSANKFRCIQFGLNLLADPIMPLWYDAPVNMTVEHVCGKDFIWVKVSTNGKSPVINASVCLFRDGEIQKTVLTNSLGETIITGIPALSGAALLTVSAKNAIPHQEQISFEAIGVPTINLNILILIMIVFLLLLKFPIKNKSIWKNFDINKFQ